MNTVSETVEALGRELICERLDVPTSAVSNACGKKAFPTSWYLPLKKIADEKGLEILPSLFKWRERA